MCRSTAVIHTFHKSSGHVRQQQSPCCALLPQHISNSLAHSSTLIQKQPSNDLTQTCCITSCSWRGVSCATDTSSGTKQVTALLLSSTADPTAVVGLQGKLPPASALKLLPGLTTVHISGQPGISGQLPESWADLAQLKVVQLHDNDLNGELPDSWAALTGLKVGGGAAAQEQRHADGTMACSSCVQ